MVPNSLAIFFQKIIGPRNFQGKDFRLLQDILECQKISIRFQKILLLEVLNKKQKVAKNQTSKALRLKFHNISYFISDINQFHKESFPLHFFSCWILMIVLYRKRKISLINTDILELKYSPGSLKKAYSAEKGSKTRKIPFFFFLLVTQTKK